MLRYSHFMLYCLHTLQSHTNKCFRVVDEAYDNQCVEFPAFLYNLFDNHNLFSSFSVLYKCSLFFENRRVEKRLQTGMTNVEHYFSSLGNKCTIRKVTHIFVDSFYVMGPEGCLSSRQLIYLLCTPDFISKA